MLVFMTHVFLTEFQVLPIDLDILGEDCVSL